jgi:hypothetical protein
MGRADNLWCRSCGSFDIPEMGVCPTCGVGFDQPLPGPERMGRVVSIRSGLTHRLAICVAEDPQQVGVVAKGSEVQSLETAAFDSMDWVSLADVTPRTAAGRLLFAARLTESGSVKARWDPTYLRAAASATATADLGARRGAAADWIGLEATDEVEALGLSDSEVTWLRAYLAAQRGAARAAVEALESLPHERYPEKVGLLIALVAEIVQEAELQPRVVALARPFREGDPEARYLVAAFDAGSAEERVQVALELTQLEGDEAPVSPMWPELARLVGAVSKGCAVRPANPGGLPLTMGLATYQAGLAAVNVDDDASWLRPITTPMYDDLIVVGSLTEAGVTRCQAVGTDVHYLRARTDPSTLTDGELQEIGAEGELARRLFERGDVAGLTQLSDSAAARHYEALLRICSAGGGNDERLRPEVAGLLGEIGRLRARLAEGCDVAIPESVLDDPTSWRFLRDEARAGRITFDPEQRARWPLFASWLDLYELQACIFANDWTRVRDLADELLQRDADETFTDEVLNLGAYAQFQLGNERVALQMLSGAIEGTHTESLVVNTSFVASYLGSEEAATFLASIHDESRDPAVGLTALLKGIDLWFADEKSVALPDALRSSIRRALSRPMPDDAMLPMLRVASRQDREWLASGPVVNVMTENQSDLVDFYTATARFFSPDHPTTLDDMTGTLITAKRRTAVAGWVEYEFTELVDSLRQQVHVDFGEAAYLTGTVTLLMNSGLLSLSDFVVLGCQVGAHLSVALGKGDDVLADESENRFLVVPLQRFLGERNELPDGEVECVEDEIARCQLIAAYATYQVVGRSAEQFGQAWDALVARERVDYQNRGAILRQEAAILEEFACGVERLRRFKGRIRSLKFDEDGRAMYRSIESDLDRWQSEVNRLRSTL